ncbi:DNA gyrase subunit B [Novimethylophilus kurashikiensis]|uniref:DNA gyrase subunit B n=1 Tax=Novimethylophilus kurashikiensis TaxID=1825523 RepID=A0A2R5F7N4_9PROT|nr:macro domain-containing protein [Novimethylophilus kurashikiensis]GBG14252.1 DNA gyrase subunit B [Novimethylophilus kurashikiensis]
MKSITGNLIKLAKAGHFDVIVHGCNCFCTMGKGIAKSIKDEFPLAYEADCQTKYGDRNKLGTFTQAFIAERPFAFTVVNAYTQFDYRGANNADYAAIRKAFRAIKGSFPNARIGYPMIGAGLAQGDWSVISGIIDEELAGEDHTLVVFDGAPVRRGYGR